MVNPNHLNERLLKCEFILHRILQGEVQINENELSVKNL